MNDDKTATTVFVVRACDACGSPTWAFSTKEAADAFKGAGFCAVRTTAIVVDSGEQGEDA
jgi:hypothetical protein